MGGGCDSLAAELHLAWHGGHFFGGVEVNRRVGENNLIDVICMLDTDTDADDSHSAMHHVIHVGRDESTLQSGEPAYRGELCSIRLARDSQGVA